MRDVLSMMEEMLSADLIRYILSFYFKDHNMAIIKKQKELKVNVLQELLDMMNSYYDDNNIKLYKNKQDQFVVRQSNNCRMVLYSASQNAEVSEEQQQAADANEIILFQDFNNMQIQQQRRVKLYIVYI